MSSHFNGGKVSRVVAAEVGFRSKSKFEKIGPFFSKTERTRGSKGCCAMQPWMRKDVLNKFGRTVKNRWAPKSTPVNPFSDPLRADIEPLPTEKRIQFWKLARGDRVPIFQELANSRSA